ncbi:MAG: hypothetical protein ACOYKM_14185 [Caulobacterales bacterium]
MRAHVFISLAMALGCAPAPSAETQRSDLRVHTQVRESQGWLLSETILENVDAEGAVQMFAVSEDVIFAIVNGVLFRVSVESASVLPFPEGERATNVLSVGTSRIVLARQSEGARTEDGESLSVYLIEHLDEVPAILRPIGSASMCNVVDATRVANSVVLIDACGEVVRLHHFSEDQIGHAISMTVEDMRNNSEPRRGIWTAAWRLEAFERGLVAVGPAPLAACGFGLRAVEISYEMQVKSETEVCLAELNRREADLPPFVFAESRQGLIIAGRYVTSPRMTRDDLRSPRDSEPGAFQSTVFQGRIASDGQDKIAFALITQTEVPYSSETAWTFGKLGDEVLVLEGRRNDSNPSPVYTAWDCSGPRSTDQDFRANFILRDFANRTLATFEATPGGILEHLYNTLYWTPVTLGTGAPAFAVQSPPHQDGSCMPTGGHRLLIMSPITPVEPQRG